MSTQTRSLLDILPGIVMPVSEVTEKLAWMWAPEVVEGQDTPAEYRASQMNLILHLGLKTTEQDALDQFHTAVDFAQKTPCRIIVLCPDSSSCNDCPLEGKLFSQCYIGPKQRESCYCEALILGYPPSQANFLENQVSVWLEADLPTYYWIHRLDPKRVAEQYLSFTQFCRRVVYDSSVDPGYADLPWPEANKVRDIAFSRLFTVRQPMGQFLSSYEPQALVEGLEKVTITHAPGKAGDAQQLLNWMRSSLEACAQQSKHPCTAKVSLHEDPQACLVDIHWSYTNDKHFDWTYSGDNCHPHLSANFGRGEINYPLQIRKLTTAEVISEALFF